MINIAEKIAAAASQQERGEFAEAEQIYNAVIGEDPNHSDACHLLGVLNHQRGDHQRAIELIGSAVNTHPKNAVFLYNLGVVHQAVGNVDSAIECFRRAAASDPKMVSVWVNLGNLQQDKGEFTDSYDCCRNAIRLAPNEPQHYLRAGIVLRRMGWIEEALAHIAHSLALEPNNPGAISSLLLASQYQAGISITELTNRHRIWAARLSALPLDTSAGETATTYADLEPHNDAASRDSSERVLTLGFVSSDFGNHPVGIFVAPLLERLKANPSVRVICYADGNRDDEFTARNRASTDEWRDIRPMNSHLLADQIRKDAVDVLFDLNGHTENNRLRMFCERPAKIQVSWAGYVGTTGLDVFDYILTDLNHTPPELEEYYSEKPLRMPGDYICYEVPEYAPEPGAQPLITNGFPTFGCLNTPAKISAPTIRLWSRLMNQHENSRLILKYKGMDDATVRTRILGLFSMHGIAADRIDLLGHTSHVEHLTCYRKIDVALDPLTYSSGLTTCESLCMGVPVVTLPGNTFASRHSMSHLKNAGINWSIAEDEDTYLQIVELLISDPAGLNHFRQTFRQQLATSPLCHLDAYARNFVEVVSGVVQP